MYKIVKKIDIENLTIGHLKCSKFVSSANLVRKGVPNLSSIIRPRFKSISCSF